MKPLAETGSAPAGSPQAAEARRVALGFGTALLVLTVTAYLKGRPLQAGILAGLLALVAVGAALELRAWLLASRVLNGLALLLLRAASRLTLCVIFYGVLTPAGLLLRLIRRRPLDTAWRDGRPSYWREPRQMPSTVSRYQKQY